MRLATSFSSQSKCAVLFGTILTIFYWQTRARLVFYRLWQSHSLPCSTNWHGTFGVPCFKNYRLYRNSVRKCQNSVPAQFLAGCSVSIGVTPTKTRTVKYPYLAVQTTHFHQSMRIKIGKLPQCLKLSKVLQPVFWITSKALKCGIHFTNATVMHLNPSLLKISFLQFTAMP